jgi:hypothetical protein
VQDESQPPIEAPEAAKGKAISVLKSPWEMALSMHNGESGDKASFSNGIVPFG